MAINNFDVILADDKWSRHIHHQLRYKVFCLETGYEDPAQFPDREEKDEWDDNAAHFIVKERGNGQWVAAMRLVLPSALNLPIEQRVPIETSLQRDQRHCAEISRLCMVGHYRRRLQGRATPREDLSSDKNQISGGVQSEILRLQRTAEILQALLKAAVAVSCEHAIDYWYMLTTRGLAKVASDVLPMDMHVAGPSCSHRGERYPYLVDVGQVMTGLMEELSYGTPAYRLHSEIAVAMPLAVGGE
jgi:N-acyl amino acid synthase of PEP-CTERM/exosortase system